jgi:AraC-like DNA-binding protein
MVGRETAMQDGDARVISDGDAWVSVRSVDDFARLRSSALQSSRYWWPDIGPLGGARNFSFTHRMRRLGPLTVLDADFHHDVWVNGGQNRPHYHVTLPVAPCSSVRDGDSSVVATPGSVAVYRPEGQAGVSRYVGRLLAVMIDRRAVEDALGAVLGREVRSQIDLQPVMLTSAPAARSWVNMVSLFTEQLFRPRSVLSQPLVGMPFVESLVRGLLIAADHPYRAAIEGEAIDPPPRWVQAAIDIIEAEADQPLTVSALAARCYVSVRSLQQGFRNHVGTTPMEYLRAVRLRRAHQMLLESDPSAVTVASVAYRWGFTNLGRFAAAHTARYHEQPAKTLWRNA